MKNAFSINIIFLLLTLVGLLLIPRLSVQLFPQKQGKSLQVGFEWRGMAAEVIEKEATSPIEGALSAMQGVERISSQSYKNRADLFIEFKKNTDMDAARFEAASILRSMHGRLPQGVELPRVNYRGNASGDSRLLVYTINGNGSAYDLKQYADAHIVPAVLGHKGIGVVNIWGAMPMQWEITYRKEALVALGLNAYDLRKSISEYLQRTELGVGISNQGNNSLRVNMAFTGNPSDSIDWSRVVVAHNNGRTIALTDVAHPVLKEQKARSYFRVNGLNTLYLVINADKGANQMALANEVKATIDVLRQAFPPGFSLMVSDDVSKEIGEEMASITSRALSALVILMLFVLLVSRRWRYLLVISLSLIANLGIAVVFYYAMGIEIHAYSLAGITVSLGMIIDNTIVMADHLRHGGNRKVFLSLLAATLTSMGAMVVIFFLKEEQRLNLIDFALVMLVNLGVSLAVALWFVPALMAKLPMATKRNRSFFKRKRHTLWWLGLYERFLRFAFRWRWAFVVAFVWGMGVPLFLLPDKIEVPQGQEPGRWTRYYNQTLGHQGYVSTVKPWVNRILGGSWYLFSSYFGQSNFNADPSKTILYARAQMPEGSTLAQMDHVISDMERYIAQFNEVEIFTSNVNSGTNASIDIRFKKEFEKGAFPHQLKNMLIDKANQIGSADFSIYGVGQGFSNAFHEGMHNNQIQMRGYNYELLKLYAQQFKDSLLVNPRIKEVLIQSESSWWQKPLFEYVVAMDGTRMAEAGSSPYNLYANLQWQSPAPIYAGYVAGATGMSAVYLSEANEGGTTVWDFQNNMLTTGSSGFRLAGVGSLKKEKVGMNIKKENQEYLLTVAYDFIGPYELNRRVKERDLKALTERLPLGYTARDAGQYWGWDHKEPTQYWLLLIVGAVVYFVCAILLNSLLKPLAVIVSIPMSFIGLFLTFALLKVNFDQGGYAAMVLLCGISVNSTLYIINQYSILMAQGRRISPLKAYLKAFNHKVVPILLTIVSTVLGLVPFIYDGPTAGFWYTLALGAGGGLLFSIPAVFVWFPLVMVGRGRKVSEEVPKCVKQCLSA